MHAKQYTIDAPPQFRCIVPVITSHNDPQGCAQTRTAIALQAINAEIARELQRSKQTRRQRRFTPACNRQNRSPGPPFLRDWYHPSTGPARRHVIRHLSQMGPPKVPVPRAAADVLLRTRDGAVLRNGGWPGRLPVAHRSVTGRREHSRCAAAAHSLTEYSQSTPLQHSQIAAQPPARLALADHHLAL